MSVKMPVFHSVDNQVVMNLLNKSLIYRGLSDWMVEERNFLIVARIKKNIIIFALK